MSATRPRIGARVLVDGRCKAEGRAHGDETLNPHDEELRAECSSERVVDKREEDEDGADAKPQWELAVHVVCYSGARFVIMLLNVLSLD